MSTIPQLGQLKKRLQELNLQKARYGIGADPHINIEADDIQTLVSLMERIDINRQRLDVLIGQRDHFGHNVPPHIVNEIMQARAQVVQLRQSCARLGQDVPTHPVDNDEPVQSSLPPRERTRTSPRSEIQEKLDLIERLVRQIRDLL